MAIPISFDYAYKVLLLQAGDEGRAQELFGPSIERAESEVIPFLVGRSFPALYLEFPLLGDPFLDVTVLYKDMAPNTRVDASAARGSDDMLEWYASAKEEYPFITCGFELDTKEDILPDAAIHFQPRSCQKLVRPFCAAVGEPERAELYIAQSKRMPPEWQLSFFGMFRGRKGAPLRVCGYIDRDEINACANDASRIKRVFDQVGFTAYDDELLCKASELMSAAPECVDFQFDVYPDGSLGTTFSLDVQFGLKKATNVVKSFESGSSARVMSKLHEWGVADDRWRLAARAAFGRVVPMIRDNGTVAYLSFTLMPQWVKVRWCNGELQPSKFYYFARADSMKE